MILGIDASRAALAKHTGTETYAWQLIRVLARLASADVRLRLYTHQPPQPPDWPASPYVETRVIPFPRLWTHARLSTELILHPPDVLFVPAHVLPLVCPVPSAVTVHDLGYLHHPEAHTPFQRRYLHWSTRRHTRLARRVIADSAATRDDLVRHYHADANRISVVHLGVDSALKPVTDTASVRQKYGIPRDYLLYIGTLQPRKNLLRLLDAFAAAGADYPVDLVLAGGEGRGFDEIPARAQSLGLQDRVIFPGFVDEADKAALLSGATAFLFPTLYEGFGLPILEAMACGTPVLTGTVSSNPEVAGEAALLVDPLDTDAIAAGLRRLLAEPDFRRELTEKGFQRAREFSWERAGKQVFEILLNS